MAMTDLGFEPRLDPPEPKAVCQCSVCGEPIYEGEDACHFDNYGWVCLFCVKSSQREVDFYDFR